MKHLLPLTFMLMVFICYGQTPVIQWVNQTGGSNAVTTTHVSSDVNGNVYSIGFFSGTIDLDPGPGVVSASTVGSSDICITKVNSDGHFVWGRTFGSSGADEGLHISVSGNELIACGFFLTTIVFDTQQPAGTLQSFGDFDAFVLKLDTSGQFVWVSQMGGGFGDMAHSLAIDSHGNTLLAGQFGGTADFDPSAASFTLTASGNFASDGFVVKLDNNGQLLWAKQLGGSTSDMATEISIDQNGSMYIGGHFRTSADMDPGAGTYTLTSNGGDDAFVVKLDSTGQFEWAHSFGASGFDLCNSLTADPQGGVVLTGPFQGNVDADPGSGTVLLSSTGNVSAYVIRLDSSGQFGFAKALKGTANVTPRHIRARGDGSIYLCGNHNGTTTLDPSGLGGTVISTGTEDAFTLSLDAAGNTRWLIHFGSTGSDDALGIDINPFNQVLLSGKFAGTCNFSPASGGPILTPAAFRDGFTLKLDDPLITGLGHPRKPDSFRFFPNPANGTVYLTGPAGGETKISVVNAFGELLLYNTTILPAHLDVQHLPAGVYFLIFENSSVRESTTLIRIE